MVGRTLTAAALLMCAIACGHDNTTSPDGQTNGTNGMTGTMGGTGGTSDSPNSITIADNSFAPSVTSVAVGSTVTWTWTGFGTHNVTFDNAGVTGAADRSSGTFEKQFNSAGTYTYQCTNHYGMTGTVLVQ